jgi:hypothetical protein
MLLSSVRLELDILKAVLFDNTAIYSDIPQFMNIIIMI